MDDLLSLDNLLDGELLSYPFDDGFSPVESPEIESLLHEIEKKNTFHERLFHSRINNFSKIKPTILFKNKKNKNGTSLLAKPPKKIKKDKNSLLAQTNSPLNNFSSNTTLLMDNWHTFSNMFCQTMCSYIYQEHNYCFNPTNSGSNSNDSKSRKANLNNNSNFRFLSETLSYCENQNEKKNGFESDTLSLLSSTFALENLNIVHDVNDYFNDLFSTYNSNSGESNVDYQDSNSETSNNSLLSEEYRIQQDEKHEPEVRIEVEHKPGDEVKKEVNKIKQELECDLFQIEKTESEIECKSETNIKIEKELDSSNDQILNDINNYNINYLENNSTCNEEEDDDIVINADILIDEMFGDFGEYDLITKKTFKNKNNFKNKNSRNNTNNKLPKTANTMSRRMRTISNSYSTRSVSSCSCCSDDISEDDAKHELIKSNNNNSCEPRKKNLSNLKQFKNKLNRKNNKIIKADNTFIRKRNRFF